MGPPEPSLSLRLSLSNALVDSAPIRPTRSFPAKLGGRSVSETLFWEEKKKKKKKKVGKVTDQVRLKALRPNKYIVQGRVE